MFDNCDENGKATTLMGDDMVEENQGINSSRSEAPV